MTDVKKLSADERELVLARRAYKRKWRMKNADKVRAANERFYNREAEKLAAEEPKSEKPSE